MLPTSTAGMDLGLGLGLDKLGQGLGGSGETDEEKRKRLRASMQGMGDQLRNVFKPLGGALGGGAVNSLFGQSPFNWFGGGK